MSCFVSHFTPVNSQPIFFRNVYHFRVVNVWFQSHPLLFSCHVLSIAVLMEECSVGNHLSEVIRKGMHVSEKNEKKEIEQRSLKRAKSLKKEKRGNRES